MPVAILIGPPGAGKSSVGKSLALYLDTQFHDTDDPIENEQGMSVSEIFLDKGETFFRECEKEIVARAGANFTGVLSLGGGSVMDSATRELLLDSEHPVIFLDVSLASAAPRIGFNRDRPLLVGNPRAKWQELMNIRRPIYEELADITVSSDAATPSQLAREIASRLATFGGSQR